MNRIVYVSLAIAAAGTFASCGEVEPLGEGSLALNWAVSPSGCEAAGVEVVEVRATGPEARIERFACSRGGVELMDLVAGSYRVELVGFESSGQATFSAEPRSVTVDSDASAAVGTFRLLAKPASVDVAWRFDNGRVCGANDVTHVVVAVFDDLDYEITRKRFPCDGGVGTIDALRAGGYLAEVVGFDDMSAIWHGTTAFKVNRGEELDVDIELEPIQ